MANFLYNGVPLPPLPEWDKETYPYAYMYHGSGGDFFAIAKRRSEPWVDGEGVNVVAFYDLVLYKVSGSAWVFLSNRDSMMHALKETDIFWTNTDLYNTDGTLYLAASDPIPVGTAPALDPLSLWLGWKAGNWVARQRGKKKQPVAFLYNGVRLPGLPEWDREKYPYALIRYEEIWDLNGNSAFQVCFLSSAAHYAISADNPNVAYVGGADIGRLMYVCEFPRGATPPNVWEYQNELSGKFGVYARSVIWSDYDILDTANSTVYLSASDPVPVYE